ncbi:hypothetical protein BC828DRAFT_66286 [Blastocladiella britannica]|nr:hypothetical protein BC828DRAFT_66286 [Blastocladiella britannica]
MSATSPPIDSRQREMLKELKKLVKDVNVQTASGEAASGTSSAAAVDLHVQAEDRAHAMLSDFDATSLTMASVSGAGPGIDPWAAIALHLVPKERSLAILLLHHVVVRGVYVPSAAGPGTAVAALNQYAYAVAGIHLAVLHSADRRHEAADKVLARAWATVKASCSGLDRREDDNVARLYDVYLLLLARATYVAGDPSDDILRHLSQMTAHKLVLDEHTYAVVALVKGLAQVKAGVLGDALTTLRRRETQEKALHEVATVASQLKNTAPPATASTAPHGSPKAKRGMPTTNAGLAIPSMMAMTNGPKSTPRMGAKVSPSPAAGRKTGSTFGVPTDVLHHCHDMHMYLSAKLDKEEDALELFALHKADYPRGSKFEAFLKHISEDELVVEHAIEYLREWVLGAEHLKSFSARVLEIC